MVVMPTFYLTIVVHDLPQSLHLKLPLYTNGRIVIISDSNKPDRFHSGMVCSIQSQQAEIDNCYAN